MLKVMVKCDVSDMDVMDKVKWSRKTRKAAGWTFRKRERES